jgi:hypothetical protein
MAGRAGRLDPGDRRRMTQIIRNAIRKLTSTGATVTITDPEGPTSNLESAGGGGAGWQFNTDPQAGGYGVLSVNEQDPTEYASTPITGKYYFRINAAVDQPNSGILFIAIGGGDFADKNAYALVDAGSVQLLGSQLVSVNTPSLDLSAVTALLTNLPTADPHLIAGQLWNNAGVVNVSAG